MTTVPAESVAEGPPPAADAGPSGAVGLLTRRSAHVFRSLWRARTAFVLTFGLPLVWLVLIGIVAGNEVIDPATDLRVMQFATPTALAMGCLFATLPSIATGVAEDRETLVLKRLREERPCPAGSTWRRRSSRSRCSAPRPSRSCWPSRSSPTA